MKAVELAKAYNPKDFEDRIYGEWKEKGEFAPKDGEGHFTVVMPPPNVTGVLHMGHALNNSLQDIIIRYKRMTGVPTLWVPGTDHAGIATQNVVERQLAKEGLRRQDLGREKFLLLSYIGCPDSLNLWVTALFTIGARVLGYKLHLRLPVAHQGHLKGDDND